MITTTTIEMPKPKNISKNLNRQKIVLYLEHYPPSLIKAYEGILMHFNDQESMNGWLSLQEEVSQLVFFALSTRKQGLHSVSHQALSLIKREEYR